MNEDTQSAEVGESAGPLAGQRLAAARRDREISIHDIAKELHLDEPKVQALEENRFDVLGAPVFAKGHLRKYAELVGVPVDDVLADYYAMNRAVGAPPVVGKVRKRPREIRLGPWVGAILLIAAVAAAGYWWMNRPPAAVSEAPPPEDEGAAAVLPATESVPVPMPAADAGETAPDAAPGGDAPDTEAVVTEAAGGPLEASAPASQIVNRSLPATNGPQVTLGMLFSGECWTEVTDASGERLFFDLGREGRRVSVSGEAPLRVLLGNANNVELTVDGRDYPITGAMRRGDTARFSIDAQ